MAKRAMATRVLPGRRRTRFSARRGQTKGGTAAPFVGVMSLASCLADSVVVRLHKAVPFPVVIADFR